MSLKSGDSAVGIAIASTIGCLWLASLGWLLGVDLHSLTGVEMAIALFVRTFLHTGLFIIAHDAMHHSLMPIDPRWNDRIGTLALWCYACLPYHLCRHNHAKHHRYPAQVGDPDFHDGTRSQLWQWYFKFMGEYLSVKQWSIFLAVVAIVGSICISLRLSLFNLLLWWILPLALSSIQLFVFGTYLPHRNADALVDVGTSLPLGTACAQHNRHRARTIDRPLWWSFLSCYHFGYHWEHHEYPQTPWYRLPSHSIALGAGCANERASATVADPPMQNLSK